MQVRRFAIAAFSIAAPLCVVFVTFSGAARSQNGASEQGAENALAWAYPVNTPGAAPAPAAPDDGSPKHVPGSTVALTLAQIRDLYNVPDWHPDDHPPAPDLVLHGRKPDVAACGYCHLPNGQGRPENAAVAGLPASYIAQQMADYKNGLRKSSNPKMGPPANMLNLSKKTTDAEVQTAAAYFAGLKFKTWIKVVESRTAPQTRFAGGMFMPVEGSSTEPLGDRIVETAENPAQTTLRDSASGFIAYVPVGSLKKGETLVTSGGAGTTVRCSTCHGADLKGSGNVPPIAGRSPSYLARQLHDMQTGARNGPGAQSMKQAVAKLSPDDIVSIVAYVASRMP